jgi:putative serine protease PepD
VTSGRTVEVVAVALLAGVAVMAAGVSCRILQSDRQALATQEKTVANLQTQLTALEARVRAQPDWAVIAAAVEPSVFTIETDSELGSAWVVQSDGRGADLLTNFHVVQGAWDTGDVNVNVHQADRNLQGTIARIDRNDDLAIVHVSNRLPALRTLLMRPALGATVMAVGSPLGLSGTISIGVVSGFRSLDGSDYMQFSAPISPGNSGGPVVDSQGDVVAIATAKLVGEGVEALSLAIPVQTACAGLVACTVRFALPTG